MYARTHTAGYSFVEVLVAIAILLISIVGPLTIASTGLKNATFAREQNIAAFLAQEGIEGVVYMREQHGLAHLDNDAIDPWDWVDDIPAECFSGTPCRFDVDTLVIEACDPIGDCEIWIRDSGSFRYLHGHSGTQSPYSRYLYFTNMNAYTIQVRSVVEWYAGGFGETESVEMVAYLSNIYAD